MMTQTRVFLIFLFSILTGANSANAAQQIMHYDVYASGFKAVTATLTMTVNKSRYDISLSAQTQGFLAKMAPWKGHFDSNGWVLKDGYRPELHMSSAIWRGNEEIKEYSYNKNGVFKKLTITEDGKKPITEIPDKALTEGTTDALTATLQVLDEVSAGGQCQGTSDVFDGRRRFTQTFRPEKMEELKRSKYNIFEGPAERCTVEVTPGPGEWHKRPRGWMSIQEQGRVRGTMPTIWMATMANGAPAIPVKIMVKTAYGTLFMHLTGYEEKA